MPLDCDLLRQFADHGDEAAFAELVRRHANFVYSVAVRVTCNGALAQDVTQAVFTTVARQAGKLRHYETLLGWLHTTTRHLAINAIRSDVRRRVREQEATAMQNINSAPETHWAEIGPLLDEAVGQLREQDREVVLLRFFKNLSHQEVGAALGLGEDAARKRVDRALEKLREYFAHRGVTTSSTLLATAIADNSVQAAPVGLAAKVTTTARAGTGAVPAVGASPFLTTLSMNTLTKLILSIVVLVILAVTISMAFWGIQTASPLNSTKAAAAVPAPMPRLMPISAGVPQVAAPVAAPAPLAPNAKIVSDPQADLSTALPDIVNLLQAGDLPAIYERYLPPDYIAQMPPQIVAQLPQQARNLMVEPPVHERLLAMARVLQAVQSQTPTLNEAGDQAVYKLDPLDTEVKGISTGNKVQQITFIKSGGKWYISVLKEDSIF